MVDGGGVTTRAYRSLNDEGSFSIGEDLLTPCLFARGIRNLDALVLTHAHYDHIDGLIDLLDNFSVGELWLGRNPMVPLSLSFSTKPHRRVCPFGGSWEETGLDPPGF
jgi:competence protein ComEC